MKTQSNNTQSDSKSPQHTPGPWGIVRGAITKKVYISGSMPGADHVLEVAIVTNLVGGMTEANARLIAAAPDLLDACKEAVHDYQRLMSLLAVHAKISFKGGKFEAGLEMIRAAIAKAEGGEK